MNEYNDELLNPKAFEIMAKEYSKNLNKNIKFVEINTNKNELKNILNDIFEHCQKINNNITCLSKFNLQKQKYNELQQLKNNFDLLIGLIIQNNEQKLCTKNLQQNYCSCLVDINNLACKCICLCHKLLEYDFDKTNHKNIVIYLTEIINCSTRMFGICKYRK